MAPNLLCFQSLMPVLCTHAKKVLAVIETGSKDCAAKQRFSNSDQDPSKTRLIGFHNSETENPFQHSSPKNTGW